MTFKEQLKDNWLGEESRNFFTACQLFDEFIRRLKEELEQLRLIDRKHGKGNAGVYLLIKTKIDTLAGSKLTEVKDD